MCVGHTLVSCVLVPHWYHVCWSHTGSMCWVKVGLDNLVVDAGQLGSLVSVHGRGSV